MSRVQESIYPTGPGILYIHAKAVVVDHRTAFVGSQNLSTSSLTTNRELGVITRDPAVVVPVEEALATDFAGAGASRSPVAAGG